MTPKVIHAPFLSLVFFLGQIFVIYIYIYIDMLYTELYRYCQLSMPYFTISLPIKLSVLPSKWPYISEQ